MKSKNDWGRLVLTSNYETRPLGELVEFVAKGIPPKYASEKTDETITVLNQKTNRNFKIDYKLARLNDLSKKKVPAEKMLIANDVLINSTGVGTAGRIAQLLSVPEPTTVDGHMIIVRADSDKINPVYLGYALKAQQKIVENLQEGSTGQTELNRQRLLDEIEIQFPTDMEKQDEIASLFLSLDNRIAENDKINHHLEQIAHSIFKSWFVDFNPFGGHVPASWNEELLFDLATVTYGKNLPTKKLLSSGYRVFGGNGQIGYYSEYLYKKERILISCRGAASGTVRLSRPYSFVTNNSLIVNEKEPELFAYLKEWSLNRQFFDAVTGSAQPQVTVDSLKLISLPKPDKETLEKFTNLLMPIYNEIEANTTEFEKLVILRDTLLPKLMTGEISVTD